LIEQAVRATAASNALVVGDRLDTDIAGAVNAGLDALLVLTGVTTAADVLAAPAAARPRYVAAGLAGMALPVEEVEVAQRPGWAVRVEPGRLVLRSTGARARSDAVGALHTLCAHWWRAGGGDDVEVRGEDDAARAALHELGLGLDDMPGPHR
jgi:glycerol 3-phosphatase-2